MREIPIEYLREALTYDPGTGLLRWKVRPRKHFSSEVSCKGANVRFAGRVAGCHGGQGYLLIGVLFCGVTRMYRAHRIAWALATGAWPLKEIDHKNGDRLDNRWSNLREASAAEQRQNRILSKPPISGLTGAYWAKGKWASHINAGGRQYYLGRFPTAELAHAAYLAAKVRLHAFQPVPRAA